MAVKIIFILLFFATMISVGMYSKKRATNVSNFVLGGRSIGPWMTAFSYGTSYFSSVVFIGYAGQFGWKYGISATWIGLGNAFIGSLLAWVVLGRRTRVMTNHLNASTMPDFFGKRFQSKAMKIVASVIVFVFLVPYTASVYNGLSKLFAIAFHIDYKICLFAMAGLTAVYVILGGYMASAITDFIQGIIMLIGIVAVIGAVLSGHGGFANALKELATNPTLTGAAYDSNTPGIYNSFFGPAPLELLSVIVLTSLGTWGLPQMVQKFYAIKSEKAIKTGTIISTLFALVVAGGSYFLGGFSRLFEDSSFILTGTTGAVSVAFDGIIPYIISTLPDILIGIVVVLVLSASMSTLSSLVLTSSSTLTLDLIKGNIIKKMSEKKQLFILRIFIAFFIVLSVVISLRPGFIAQLMGISWGALAGAFLAPFMYSLYSKKITKASVWTSFVTGVGITVLNLVFGSPLSPIMAGALAMIVGLIVVPTVSLFTKKLSKEFVGEIFAGYDEKVEVSKKTVLEEGQ